MGRRAPKSLVLEWNEAGWDELLTGVVKNHLEPRAEAVAKAANAHVESMLDSPALQENPDDLPGITKRKKRTRALLHEGPPEGKRDYMVDSEGSNPLNLNDYRATVISVSHRAKVDNARNNTLITYLHLAAGD